jgi:DNA-binding NarL/FixJ family response regulator
VPTRAELSVALNLGEAHKVRVLVVEDNAFVREGLVNLINRQADLVCCGEADSIAATSALVPEIIPELVMVDLQLKDGEAFDLIVSLTHQFPTLPVLVVSQSGEKAHVEKALRDGAKGYVLKQDATEEVLPAIRSLLQGDFYVSRSLMG